MAGSRDPQKNSSDADRRETVKKLILALPGSARDVLVDLYHSAYPPSGPIPSAEKELFSALRATLNSLTLEGALSRRAFLQLGGLIATGGLLQSLYPEKAHAWQAWTGFWQNISTNSYVANTGTDPYWDYVALLMNFDGSNGSTVFSDESNVGNAPTISGSVYCDSAITRASMAGSTRFVSSSSSYITFAHVPGFAFGSSDFTIECFLRLNTTGSQFISAHHNYGSVAQFYFALNSSSQVYFNGYVSNSAPALVGTTSLTTGAFYHIAVTRSGGTLRLFVNGTQEASASISGALDNPGTPWNIGRQTNGSAYLDGWLSDYRVYNGVAKYTANFTPPTAAIGLSSFNDPYWGYCVLACPFDNSLKDCSGKKGSASGAASLSTSVKKYGSASASFNGSNSYISFNDSTDFDLGVSNQPFTLEAFVYLNASTGSDQLIFFRGGATVGWDASTGIFYDLFYENSSGKFRFNFHRGSSASAAIVGTTSVSTGAWYHVAVSYDGTVTRLFVNGNLEGTSTSNFVKPTTCANASMGAILSQSYLNGYIDSLRITKGYARYTAPFTPPTAAFPVGKDESSDPFWTNTVLAMHMEDLTDSTGRHVVTAGGSSAVSTSQYRYGSKSASFSGSPNYFQSSTTSWDFDLAGKDWTVEFFVQISSQNYHFMVSLESGGGSNSLQIYSHSNGKFAFGGRGTFEYTSSSTFAVGVWHHVAMTRQSGYLRYFVNGNLEYSNSSLEPCQSSAAQYLTIGGTSTYSGGMTGYLDDLRITKGVARYTQNFTPPTKAFATTATVPVSDYDPFWAEAVLAMSGQGTNGSAPTADLIGDTLTTTGTAQIVTSGSPKFYGSHYSFNGSSYITATPDSLFDLGISGEPFTIRLWMKSSYTATGQYIISHSVGGLTWGSGGEQWILFCSASSGGYIAFQWVGSGSPSSVSTTTTLIDGNYHHIEVSYDGTTTYLFVDGVLKNSSTGTYTKQTGGSTSTRIGGQGSGSAHFNGNLTDVEIYKGVCLHTVSFCPPIKGISTVGYGSSGLNIVTSGLVASLDASAYDGSSQVWRNTVGSPADSSSRSAYNFYLGSSSSSESSDPAFVGVPLGGTANDYFSMNGSQYFTLAGGNTTFINSMHKKSAQFTIIGVFMINSSGGYTLFGTANYNAGSARGVTVMGSSTEITFTPYQDGGSNMGSLATSTGAISLGVPHFVAVSITEAGSSFIYLDGSYAVSPQTFTYSQTITSDVPNTAKIGTYADAGGRTLNGRLYQLMLYNRALSKAEVDQIFGAVRGRYGI